MAKLPPFDIRHHCIQGFSCEPTNAVDTSVRENYKLLLIPVLSHYMYICQSTVYSIIIYKFTMHIYHLLTSR